MMSKMRERERSGAYARAKHAKHRDTPTHVKLCTFGKDGWYLFKLQGVQARLAIVQRFMLCDPGLFFEVY